MARRPTAWFAPRADDAGTASEARSSAIVEDHDDQREAGEAREEPEN